MKILHVTRSISRDEGGPARSVQGLVAAQNKIGVESWLLPMRKGPLPWVEGVVHFSDSEPFENLAFRIKPDVVHIHGLWNLEEHRCVVICRRWRIPYVISPRGMLEPWSLKQKWFKKRIARFLYQDNDLKYAAALHATAESEAEQFRKLGFKNPVIISPNGVNLPLGEGVGSQELGVRGKGSEKRMLIVSRMHPQKGVLELVEAIKRVMSGGVEEWRNKWRVELVYTVNGEFEREYEAKVKARVKELGLEDAFIFTGALDDEAKWESYRRADLFVLPTYSENFGIVVAEALWAGVPVITTKGTPWSELETEKCGWWIDLPTEISNSLKWEALDLALAEAFLLSDVERFEMGKRGRALVNEKYIWESAASKMIDGYKEVLNARG